IEGWRRGIPVIVAVCRGVVASASARDPLNVDRYRMSRFDLVDDGLERWRAHGCGSQMASGSQCLVRVSGLVARAAASISAASRLAQFRVGQRALRSRVRGAVVE